MEPNNFDNPPTFHVVPQAGQCFHLSSEIAQHLRDGLAQNTDPHGMNPGNFSDHLTFPLAPPGD